MAAGASWSMLYITDLMTSTAEISNLVSVITVLMGLVVMLVFLIRLIYQDIADGGSGVTKVNVKTPQTIMTRVDVPFTLSLQSDTTSIVKLKLASKCAYSIKYSWAVPISSFHHMLRSPWQKFYKSTVSSDLDSHSGAHDDREIILQRPQNLNLGQAPREVYPLVVILVKLGSENTENYTAVTSLVKIIHLKDATCPIPSQVLSTYIRQGSGLTQLRPLFVTDSGGGECSDTESAEDSETEDWPSSGGIRSRCVVCQLARVNRVALPCRHANTCASCFDRLQSRCPMCRGFISSYFLLFPDPDPPPQDKNQNRVSEPEVSAHARRSWTNLWNEWNVRINAAMGLQEN